ncbi:MAG: hypothetical protein ACHQYP_10460 [Nitrospiria bacterium]
MKTKSKASKKNIKKKATKKVTSSIKNKKASAKPAKKPVTAKKTRRAKTRETKKQSVAKKKEVSTVRKKKTPSKPLKRSTPTLKKVIDETPTIIIAESAVTVTTTIPNDEFSTVSPPGRLIGIVTGYHNLFSIAEIDLESGTLSVGDTIYFKGDITDFEQEIESLKIDHDSIETAEEGQIVEVKVIDVVQENDKVYKL